MNLIRCWVGVGGDLHEVCACVIDIALIEVFEREGKREHLDICEMLLALVEIYSMRSLCSDHL